MVWMWLQVAGRGMWPAICRDAAIAKVGGARIRPGIWRLNIGQGAITMKNQFSTAKPVAGMSPGLFVYYELNV